MSDLLATLIILGVIGGGAYYVHKHYVVNVKRKLDSRRIPHEEFMTHAVAIRQPVVKVPKNKVLVAPKSDALNASDVHELNSLLQLDRIHTPEQLSDRLSSQQAESARIQFPFSEEQPESAASAYLPPFLSGKFNSNESRSPEGVERYLIARNRVRQMAENLGYDNSMPAAQSLPDTPIVEKVGNFVGSAVGEVRSVPTTLRHSLNDAERFLARQGNLFRKGYLNAGNNV